MYQYTDDPNVLLCLETGAWIPRGHRDWPTEWLLSHTPEPIPPPYLPGTPAHHRAIRDAAWAWMATVVKGRGYDSIESCCSYYNSGVARYKAEARAMVAWRDAVNTALETMVLNPPAGVDTWDEVQALLSQPEAFNWPPKVDLPLDGLEPPIQLP
jgi:hypothetical protein